jgi:hypothetical protein
VPAVSSRDPNDVGVDRRRIELIEPGVCHLIVQPHLTDSSEARGIVVRSLDQEPE